MSAAVAHKEAGTAAFSAGDYRRALSQYSMVIGCIGGLRPPPALSGVLAQLQPSSASSASSALTPQQQAQVQTIEVAVHLNLSLCYLTLNHIAKAIESANTALTLDSNNAKGYYRRGCALHAAGNLDAALEDFRRSQQLQPNAQTQQQIRAVQQAIAERDRASSEALARRLQKGMNLS